MPDAIWSALLGPATLLLMGFILDQMIRPAIRRRNGKGAVRDRDSPVVGETIPSDPAEPWRLAYDSVVRERDDERGDFDRYRRNHRACHDVMRDNGLKPPHE